MPSSWWPGSTSDTAEAPQCRRQVWPPNKIERHRAQVARGSDLGSESASRLAGQPCADHLVNQRRGEFVVGLARDRTSPSRTVEQFSLGSSTSEVAERVRPNRSVG